MVGAAQKPRPSARFRVKIPTWGSIAIRILLLVACFAVSPADVNAAVQVSLELMPDAVEAGDVARLRITVSGAVQIDEPPTLPSVEGISFSRAGQSTQVSIVNGRMTRSVTFDFIVRTQNPGEFSIGPAEVRDGGTLTRSEVVRLQVVTVGGASSGQSQAPTSSPDESRPESAAGGAIFVRAVVDDSEVYVGEQVTLRFQFYQRVGYPVLDTRLEAPPTTLGFLRQDIPPQRTRRVTVEGAPYQVTELVYGLFPTQTGTLEIGTGVVTCTVRETNRRSRDPFSIFGMFDDREVTLRSRPITIRVKALPEPKPSDFTGGVGRFEMRSSVDRIEVAQGEPVTLSVRIEGTGNVPSVGMPPLPDLAPQFRAFAPSAPAYEPKRNDEDKMGGWSDFSVVLVPETTGSLVVPPIQVSVFSPASGRYEHLSTDSLLIRVTPGIAGAVGAGGEVTRTGWDLRTIRGTTELAKAGEGGVWSRWTFWVLQVTPLLLLGAAWMMRRRQADQRRNWTQILGQRAPSQFRKRLRELTSSTRIDVKEGYARLEAALAEYLRHRFGFSLAGRSREDLRAMLEQRGVDRDAIATIISVLERCDFARFAPGSQPHGELTSIAQEAERAVSLIEQIRPPATRSRAAAASTLGALLVCAIASGLSAQSPPGAVSRDRAMELFRAGNAAFERSEYREAIEQYRQVLDSGYESPDLLLNLGDAYYRAGKIGWAVHSFERGRRLDPVDPDLRANLDLALRANQDRTDEPDQSRFLSFLVRVQDRFPLQTSIWIASALWWVFAFWMIARILGRIPRRADSVTVLLVALLVGAVSWTAVQAIGFRTQPNAVVVTDEAAVRSNPDDAATVEFTLHGGTLLRMGRRAPGFREVIFSDELHGWTDDSNLAPL